MNTIWTSATERERCIPVDAVGTDPEAELGEHAEHGAVHRAGPVTHQELLAAQVVRQRLNTRSSLVISNIYVFEFEYRRH